ncbi:MAG TPA: MFS transporter [Solirubrobacteraceae bacterium]|jgi:MFS family permease
MPRLARQRAIATKDTTGGSNGAAPAVGENYRWVVLSNMLLAGLIVSIDSTIVLIALPSIFRGIGVDPLHAGNTKYMLWMIMGFLIVTAVLVVSLGRLGDIYGRVRVYNLGFAVFTVFSILLSVAWLKGDAGADWLIVMRIGQGLGGAMLLGNSSAIVTDAFPAGQRGTALGIMNIGFVAGSTIGLVLGGVLAPISWRLIFLVSVPIGLVGTVWSYKSLRDIGEHRAAHIDWWGNLTFAVGLIAVMIAVTTGIQPYKSHTMSWGSPKVLGEFGIGFVLLCIFAIIESRVAEPMFHLRLYRIRAFTAGNFANLLTSLARGGLQFILIIWLQGIWLPEHGYNFSDTPLWSGILMLPVVAGLLIAGPISGILSDRFGARPFATAGPLLAGLSFFLLARLPVNFPYAEFALLLALNGIGMGLFISPNRAAVMNSLPPWRRGVGAGMMNTFQNSAQVLSIGIFFSLMIIGLSGQLPATLYHGIVAHGVAPKTATTISHLPPVTTLFATFLGYNPMKHLLGAHVLASLPASQVAVLTGHRFFPQLITKPFSSALHSAFTFAVITCVAAAIASLLRGGRHEWTEPETTTELTEADEDGQPMPVGADGARPPALGGGLERPPLGALDPRLG